MLTVERCSPSHRGEIICSSHTLVSVIKQRMGTDNVWRSYKRVFTHQVSNSLRCHPFPLRLR